MTHFTATPPVFQTSLPSPPGSPRENPSFARPTRFDREQRALAAHMEMCLTVIRIAERLPILSQEIMEAASQGESKRALRQRLTVLHTNLIELAELATQAKTEPISVLKT